MKYEKELILNELMSKIKEGAENTNFAYAELTLQLAEQIQNEFKEKYFN